MQLFGNRESGHTYKVRLMLALAGIAYDYTEIDITLPREQRPEAFRAKSKYGEVPLLVHGGRAYAQSNAILIHLAGHTSAFGGESPQRLARVTEWLFWEANRIGFSLPNLRFGLTLSPDGLAPQVEHMLRDRFAADIGRLDEELADGRAFILDDAPSVVDIALCAYLYWPEQAGVSIPAHVQAWLERISALPGWQHPYALTA